MSNNSVPDSKNHKPGVRSGPQSMFFAVIPSMLVVVTLFAGFIGASFEIRLLLFSLTTIAVLGLLVRLYRAIYNSRYAEHLASSRIHILLHIAPFVFFVAYITGLSSSRIDLILIILIFLFFLSGRLAWKAFMGVFPSTDIYGFFYRGNSAFMASLPIMYLASLLLPEVVGFGIIQKIALFYFSIHFMILGVSCLKIETDLQLGP